MCVVAFYMDLIILLEQKCQDRSSVVTHACNPSHLGGLSRRKSVCDKLGLHNENLSKKKKIRSYYIFISILYFLLNTLVKPVLYSKF